MKNKRRLFLAICMILTLLMSANTAWAKVKYEDSSVVSTTETKDTNAKCSISFKLPENLGKTSFSVPMVAVKELNGEKINYQFKGKPFLIHNQTYIPTRDIAEAFGISVLYNPQDRAVRLIDKGKELIIMPLGNPYARVNCLKLPSNETDFTGYVLINGTSYVPLRFILEYFSFDVQYSNQQVTISGEITANQSRNDFFADSTYDVVTKAFSSYESAKKASFEGLYYNSENDKTESIRVTMNKLIGSGKVEYKYDIKVGKKHYTADAIGYSDGQGSGFQSNAPSNMEQLHMGGHPYSYIGAISIGVSKYLKQENILVYEDEKILKYQTEKNDYGTESVEISKQTGKLLRIISSNSHGTVTKDLKITY